MREETCHNQGISFKELCGFAVSARRTETNLAVISPEFRSGVSPKNPAALRTLSFLSFAESFLLHLTGKICVCQYLNGLEHYLVLNQVDFLIGFLIKVGLKGIAIFAVQKPSYIAFGGQ